MSLRSLSISAKMLLIIAILVAACLVVTGIALNGFAHLQHATKTVEEVAEAIHLKTRMSQNVVELTRAEYRLAATPQSLSKVRETVAASRDEFESRLDRLRALTGTADMAEIAALEAAYRSYVGKLEGTIAEAAQQQDLKASAERQAILDAVDTSHGQAVALRDLVRDMVSKSEVKIATVTGAADDMAERDRALLIGIAAVGILAGLVLGLLISQLGIRRPLQAIVACLKRLAEGDMAAEIPGIGRGDEIGQVAEAAQSFKSNLIRNREMEAEAQQAEVRQREAQRANMLQLADRFEQRVGAVVASVSGAATELQVTAQQLAAAVEETDAQSGAVSAAAEQASANVQTVAAAAEELGAAITEVAQQVTGSANMARTAAEGAENARQQLDQLVKAIEEVDQVVDAINDVAEQTNLLALNATIEAARAGEAGKGFAVVATEVKNLANQTRQMTDGISRQISAVKTASAKSVDAARQILQQVGEIDTSASSMAASVEEQSAATQEISRNAQEASTGTMEVSRNIGGVREATSETAAASANVRNAADGLAENSAHLKQEMDSLLAEIRAA